MEPFAHDGFDFKKGFLAFIIVLIIIIGIASVFYRRQPFYYPYYYWRYLNNWSRKQLKSGKSHSFLF